MRCSLYSSDGPLMSEGTCDLSDGTVEMLAERWHMTPEPGGAPLTLIAEGGQPLLVRVDDVHVIESDPASGPQESYRLTVLDANREPDKGGLLGGLKSMFRHKGET
jgi:hypothetical protein